MNKIRIDMMKGNRITLLILLIFFSILSIYIPHGAVEAYEHNEYENLFKFFTNSNKPESSLKKILKKIRVVFLKIIRLPQVKTNIAEITNAILSLFNINISAIKNLHMFSVLCHYFHGGKFKIESTLICCH